MSKARPRMNLTLGPVLFNWPVGRWVDFYARVADEAPVDRVCLGEVVCSKRQPFKDDGVVIGPVDPLVGAVPVHRVGDQRDGALVVVDGGEVGGQQQQHVR